VPVLPVAAPVPESAAEGAGDAAFGREIAAAPPAVARAAHAAAARALRAPLREPVVVAALPFLLLRPLSQLGYLEALGGALEVEKARDGAEAFGAALAAKVLDPPERGWRRTPATVATQAAFAGDAGEHGVTDLARRTAPFAPVLDGLVAAALVAGRQRGDALLLRRTPRGDHAVIDPRGCFPLAIAGERPALDAVLRAAGRPALRAPRGPELHRLDALLAALEARPAAPLASDAMLDRTVALAAATALGMIAWELWSEREPTDPLLALERFSTLDARVRVEPERVLVTLPMGRRRDDLASHGLLAEVLDVPWLAGIPVVFTGV
jgi:hypothetical protein